MPTDKQLYVAKLNEIARRYGSIEDDTVARAIALLRDFRKQVAAEITLTDWAQYRQKELIAGIDRLIQQFEGSLVADFRAGLRGAVDSGAAYVIEPLQAADIGVIFNQATISQVNTATDFSADLIVDIGNEMRKKVNQEIRLALLGGRSHLDAMNNITKALGLEVEKYGRAKRVGGIRYGAERILRTEMQRAFNLSAFAQQQSAAQQEPGLRKAWVATADNRTRQTHLIAHSRYRDNPIPIEEPFVVGTSELMYPGDPAGPASETVNCRCRSVTIHPLIGNVGTPLDARIEKELKKRK